MSKIATNKENKELDKLSNSGSNKVLKMNNEKRDIAKAMKQEGMKEAVMDYIFDGNPETASPLQDIRDSYK